MKSSFKHKKSGKKLEKWTYAQSYPHYPQKKVWFTINKWVQKEKICSVKCAEKKLLYKKN